MSKIVTTITIKFMGELDSYTNTVPEKHAIGHLWTNPMHAVIDAVIEAVNKESGPRYVERGASFTIETDIADGITDIAGCIIPKRGNS